MLLGVIKIRLVDAVYYAANILVSVHDVQEYLAIQPPINR